MTTRSEKEKQKAQQEKFQAILSNLLKDDDNKYCVDCDAKGPRWAAWNLGIFLCIRCAGIHRNLGVHISKVKSVNLDTWTPEQVAMMMEIGNSRARAAYEANLPDNYRRPQTDSALESFVRAKYEHKKYMAKEWVQPKPVIPKELLEDDKDKRKSKPKSSSSVSLSSVPRSQTGSSSTSQSSSSNISKPTNPKPVQNAQVTSTQKPTPPPNNSSSSGDLIGLVFAQASPVDVPDAPSAPATATSNSLLEDFMGGGGPTPTASQPPSQSNNTQASNGLEASLFGDMGPSDNSKANVSTKDSIMALFGGQQQTQTQFGVPVYSTSPSPFDCVGGVMPPKYTYPCEPQMMFTYSDTGGVYMQQQQPQQQQQQQQQAGMGGGMYGMQQPQVQQQMPVQQGMYGNQMGMMGMQPGQMAGMQGVGMGMISAQPGMGMVQQGMAMPQQQGVAMYGQPQPQMQQMQFNQMQNQMAGMNLGQQPALNMGWGGAQNSGHTLSTNLWQ